ncbi:Ig-like domain-containing protein [Anaerovorax odorimutans]|uniref:Ig-like domain-containing protein n=1 Tax=Anaerovorax odorimutans TaxID=109327 RepID=A0ABT1RKD2_9FIRM|nr:Ig-like domain-containing protein [Anaerovorax odorimutans]MCQ4635653.1 Ig-like domain-containing protein [Anaerovorax odorimutans]
MNVTRRSNQRVIVSIVMALMIALSMMPGLAFADTALSINPVGTVYMGDSPVLSVTPAPDNVTSHIDWSSSNESVATISTHNGKITTKAAGTTTITATLREGAKPSGGGGGTTGDCTGAILGTATLDVTILPTTAYGAQGIGGNTLTMLSPNNITAGQLSGGQYLNRINNTLAVNEDGFYEFKFTMGAGMNNFNEQNFITQNMPLIKVTQNGRDIATFDAETIVYGGYENPNIIIGVDSSVLATSGEYVLEFGADIHGNNASKTLGVPVKFIFNI